MQTSDKGVAFIERHEGVATKAYRDPVGVWTIGAGLTKASGVVRPRAGMTITRERASELLATALRRNYEPAVARAMPGAAQHEFDGGVSFHFNTGAIHRASWVEAWRRRDWDAVSDRIRLWRKAQGRVLPGLERRRADEFRLIRHGEYAGSAPRTRWQSASFVVPVEAGQRGEIRGALRALGYEPGPETAKIARAAVERFQADHDLVVDGLIGRATLSTLQRRIDARGKANEAAGAAAGAGGVAGAGETGLVPVLPDWVVWAALAAGAVFVVWTAWRYRDAIAAKLQRRLPAIARMLRSV